MKRADIEMRVRLVQSQLSRASHPSELATLNRCLERLIMMDADDELEPCETCGGVGRVTVDNNVVTDALTKWKRSAVERVVIECATCNGRGVIDEQE